MHSALSPIGSHIVTFAKQYREGELRDSGYSRVASSMKRLVGTTRRRSA
jgi:hypothetical protein